MSHVDIFALRTIRKVVPAEGGLEISEFGGLGAAEHAVADSGKFGD
jgi:hypothetical protein